MKNKKGFAIYKIIILTILLSFIFVILYTNIKNANEISKQKKYENYKSLIIDAARTWKAANNIQSDITISLCTLQSEDYIGELINPLTNEKIPSDSKVIIENGNYTFIEGTHNLESCTSDNIYVYYELDANNSEKQNLPEVNFNPKKVVITLNDEKVENVYINKQATYKIIYTLENNTTYTKYIIVRDTTAPEININNNNYNKENKTIKVYKNSNFTLPSVNFTDNSMRPLETTVVGAVDTTKTGTYKITYKAVDESKNEQTLIINVIVESPNQNENYYVDTNTYTNNKNITLTLKALNAKEMCISNTSLCTNWQPYKESIKWDINQNNTTIYVYYKTDNNEIVMTTTKVYLDITTPEYHTSKNVLLGVSYNLNDIVKAYDSESGIGNITTNNSPNYKPEKLGVNNVTIEITDKAGNKIEKQIPITAYNRIKCDASISNEVNEDGLKKDPYNQDRCIYVGSNPNNYITFNNELYRIISIENDGKIKIIKDEPITQLSYGTTSFDSSNIKTYLNGKYYNDIKTKNLISENAFLYGTIYGRTFDEIINNDTLNKTQTLIALPSLSDYLKASTCNTTWDKIISNNNPCKQNNWLNIEKEYWLLTNYDNKPLYVSTNSSISYINPNATKEIRPVIYLNPNSAIIDGNGTKDNSYKLLDNLEATTLKCEITTSQEYELTKELTVFANKNAVYSFDGINWSNSNKKEVAQDGIIKVYIKDENEMNYCSIKLYSKEEYRYKTCPSNNIRYSNWYISGTSKEALDYVITTKENAEQNYLTHYETVDEAPCNNCKWVTKYERKVESCTSFDDAPWSAWSPIKPASNPSILIDKPVIKYGIK